jgi:hypothetical protein
MIDAAKISIDLVAVSYRQDVGLKETVFVFVSQSQVSKNDYSSQLLQYRVLSSGPLEPLR